MVAGPDDNAARDTAFRTLFDYISGANRTGEEVAMTVPVETAGRSLFYDPPWTIPFLRRNEVAIPMTPH